MKRYQDIPLEFIRIKDGGIHIMVRATVNGMSANFLLDTGASQTVFNRKSVEDFQQGATFEAKEGVTSGINKTDMQAEAFTLSNITIGELSLSNYEGIALDLSHINNLYTSFDLPRIDALLGGDFFKKYKAIINYRSKKMRLWGKKDK